MRTTLAAAAALVAAPALAHPGHIAPSGGHDHIIVLAVGGLLCAVVAGAALLVSRRRDR